MFESIQKETCMRKLPAFILLFAAFSTHAASEPCPEVLGLGVLAKTTDKEMLRKLDELGCRYTHYRGIPHAYEIPDAACLGLPEDHRVRFTVDIDRYMLNSAAVEFPRTSKYGFDFYEDALERKYGKPYRPARTTAKFREVLWKTDHWGIVLHRDHAGDHGTIMYMSARHLERFLDNLRHDEERKEAEIRRIL